MLIGWTCSVRWFGLLITVMFRLWRRADPLPLRCDRVAVAVGLVVPRLVNSSVVIGIVVSWPSSMTFMVSTCALPIFGECIRVLVTSVKLL